jgi:hypothetical protein
MRSGSETDVKEGLQTILDRLAPGRFLSAFRKTSGGSMIGKPVDLEIGATKAGAQRALIAVEVANVNTSWLGCQRTGFPQPSESQTGAARAARGVVLAEARTLNVPPPRLSGEEIRLSVHLW